MDFGKQLLISSLVSVKKMRLAEVHGFKSTLLDKCLGFQALLEVHQA